MCIIGLSVESKKEKKDHVKIDRNWLWKCKMKIRGYCVGPQSRGVEIIAGIRKILLCDKAHILNRY